MDGEEKPATLTAEHKGNRCVDSNPQEPSPGQVGTPPTLVLHPRTGQNRRAERHPSNPAKAGGTVQGARGPQRQRWRATRMPEPSLATQGKGQSLAMQGRGLSVRQRKVSCGQMLGAGWKA